MHISYESLVLMITSVMVMSYYIVVGDAYHDAEHYITVIKKNIK